MDKHAEDQPVLNYIQHLVQRNTDCTTKGSSRTPIVNGSRKSKSNWISAGISCVSDVPFAMSGLTRRTRKFARRRSSRIMSSSDSL